MLQSQQGWCQSLFWGNALAAGVLGLVVFLFFSLPAAPLHRNSTTVSFWQAVVRAPVLEGSSAIPEAFFFPPRHPNMVLLLMLES